MLSKLVKSRFGTEAEVSKEIERIEKVYRSRGTNDVDAEAEFVAKQLESLLGNEEFIRDLVKYHTSIASKIVQDLGAFTSDSEIVQIRNTFEKAFEEFGANEAMQFSFDAISKFAYEENGEIADFRSQLSHIDEIPNDQHFVLSPKNS